MTKWSPAPIIGGAYTDEAKPWACQDTVNWLPVRIERPNGRSDWKLTPVPGIKVFSAFTNATTGTSDRVRGLRNVEGALYVVCGQSLFRVNTSGTVETIQENAIPGTGRVTMTHNQETGGYSLVMTNGYGGWTYNSGTATFAEITDEGFPGFKTCDFLDQYIVGISPDGLFAFHSDLANASEYSTLDRYSAEAAPDRLVGQVADHGQWWLFGERTTEIYTNTGASTGTFQRIPGSTIERGLAGTHAVAKLDNSVFWVGDDGVVYRANGFTPVRISTHPIERELSQCDLSQAFCLVYEDRGHKVLYVTCPDGKTWGYDVAAQEWHRRESYGRSNWRVTSLARWAGGWLGGDELTNRLQRVAWEYRDEDGSPLVVRRTTGILHANENRIQLNAIKLVIDSGRIPGQPRTLQNNTYPVEIYNPLTAAYVGVAVDHDYLGRFGVTPYTFAVVAGSLPTGLSLASDGSLTGTPSAAGQFAWRVRITDAIGQTDTLDQGIDLASGIDAGEVFEVGYAGTWMYGPVAQNGASGGSELFYLKANTPTGLYSATPVALPAQGSGSLVRLSIANGAVFMHRGANGSVSFDNGATWAQCSIGLSSTLNVFWDGSFYFNGGSRSADGITWSAITTFPGTATQVALARPSDGAVVCVSGTGASTQVYVSTDSGATWTMKWAAGATVPTVQMTTNGTRIWFDTAAIVKPYYTDNLFTSVAPITSSSNNGKWIYANNAVMIGAAVRDLWRMPAGAITTVKVIDNIYNGGANNQGDIAYGGGVWAAENDVNNGVAPKQRDLFISSDDGFTWAAGGGTLYGDGGSLVYAEPTV